MSGEIGTLSLSLGLAVDEASNALDPRGESPGDDDEQDVLLDHVGNVDPRRIDGERDALVQAPGLPGHRITEGGVDARLVEDP